MIELENYRKVNASYRKVLVFNFGAFAGFYSEYNNMLKAIAFCLVNKIRFKLYSKDAKFCPVKGWSDYFESFVDEVEDDIHLVLNKRVPDDPYRTAFFSLYLKRKIKKIVGKTNVKVSFSFYDTYLRNRRLKRKYGFRYFTFDLWNDFVHINLNNKVIVESLYSGTYFGLIRELDKMIWRYNLEIKNKVQERISSLNLPKQFVAMHIRGGDKILEADLINWEKYVVTAYQVKVDCRNWFVFTDDYSIIESIKKDYPDYQLSSLCDSRERGYFYGDFLNDKSTMVDKMIRMFASVDICKQAEFFIGTATANPFFVVFLAKDGKNCVSLD